MGVYATVEEGKKKVMFYPPTTMMQKHVLLSMYKCQPAMSAHKKIIPNQCVCLQKNQVRPRETDIVLESVNYFQSTTTPILMNQIHEFQFH